MNKVIVFDVSETIDKYPEACSMLANSLYEAGWQVVICSPNKLETIYFDLSRVGIDKDKVTIENTGHKGDICEKYGAALFLDDNESYLSQCFNRTKTMPLKVLDNPACKRL